MGEDTNRPVSRRDVVKAGGAAATVGLAGCGGNGDGGDGGDGQTTTPTTDQGTATTDAPGTTTSPPSEDLTFWAWTVWVTVQEDLAESYEGPHSVTVEEKAPGNISAELLTALRTQTNMPSISLLRQDAKKRIFRSGGVLNLGDLVSEYEDMLFDVAKSRTLVDGEWPGVPNDVGPIAFWYNRNLFDQAGLPTVREDLENEIETWEDFIGAGETLNSETGADMIAMEYTGQANGFSQATMTQLGGRWYNKESGEFEYNQPANAQAFETMRSLKAINNPLSRGSSQFWGAMQNENVATICAPAWMLGYATASISDMSGDWGVFRLPRHESSPTEYNERASNFGGAACGIPAALNTPVQDAAKDFLVHSQLSEEAFNASLRLGGFPAHMVEGAEQITAESEFFGGQQKNQVYIDAAQASPPQYNVPNARVNELHTTAVRQILQDDEDIQTVLDDTQSQMENVIPEEDMTIEGTVG